MLIVCPTARPPTRSSPLAGAAGRPVRCMRCRKGWLCPAGAPRRLLHAALPDLSEMRGCPQPDLGSSSRPEIYDNPRALTRRPTGSRGRRAPKRQPDWRPRTRPKTSTSARGAPRQQGTRPAEEPVRRQPELAGGGDGAMGRRRAAARADTEIPLPMVLVGANRAPLPAGRHPAGRHSPRTSRAGLLRAEGRGPLGPASAANFGNPPCRRLIIGLMALAALVGWRGDVVGTVPQIASLYAGSACRSICADPCTEVAKPPRPPMSVRC